MLIKTWQWNDVIEQNNSGAIVWSVTAPVAPIQQPIVNTIPLDTTVVQNIQAPVNPVAPIVPVIPVQPVTQVQPVTPVKNDISTLTNWLITAQNVVNQWFNDTQKNVVNDTQKNLWNEKIANKQIWNIDIALIPIEQQKVLSEQEAILKSSQQAQLINETYLWTALKNKTLEAEKYIKYKDEYQINQERLISEKEQVAKDSMDIYDRGVQVMNSALGISKLSTGAQRAIQESSILMRQKIMDWMLTARQQSQSTVSNMYQIADNFSSWIANLWIRYSEETKKNIYEAETAMASIQYLKNASPLLYKKAKLTIENRVSEENIKINDRMRLDIQSKQNEMENAIGKVTQVYIENRNNVVKTIESDIKNWNFFRYSQDTINKYAKLTGNTVSGIQLMWEQSIANDIAKRIEQSWKNFTSSQMQYFLSEAKSKVANWMSPAYAIQSIVSENWISSVNIWQSLWSWIYYNPTTKQVTNLNTVFANATKQVVTENDYVNDVSQKMANVPQWGNTWVQCAQYASKRATWNNTFQSLLPDKDSLSTRQSYFSDTTPVPWAMVFFDPTIDWWLTWLSKQWWHIAVVQKVNQDWSIVIEDSNYSGTATNPTNEKRSGVVLQPEQLKNAKYKNNTALAEQIQTKYPISSQTQTTKQKETNSIAQKILPWYFNDWVFSIPQSDWNIFTTSDKDEALSFLDWAIASNTLDKTETKMTAGEIKEKNLKDIAPYHIIQVWDWFSVKWSDIVFPTAELAQKQYIINELKSNQYPVTNTGSILDQVRITPSSVTSWT
jgi:surface antigen